MTFDQIQQREARCCIVDVVGKGGRTRSVPMAAWTKQTVDAWADAAEIGNGRIFGALDRWADQIVSDRMTPQAVRDVVRRYANGLADDRPDGYWDRLAPHDLRRIYAQLARASGAALEQVSVNLGHASASLRTTERHLGVKLNLQDAPADRLPLPLNSGDMSPHA